MAIQPTCCAARSQFPDGQFVAEYEGRIVGYCATFRIDEAVALAPHSWNEITGGGYASRHDPNGDWLYGMEVCVDPDFRGLRIGQRLYDARKQLCRAAGPEGHRLRRPDAGLGAAHRKRTASAEAYLDAVHEGKSRDPVSASSCATASSRSACCPAICRPTTSRGATPRTWSGAIRSVADQPTMPQAARAAASCRTRCASRRSSSSCAASRASRSSRSRSNISSTSPPTTASTSSSSPSCSRCSCCRSRTRS